MLKREKEKPQNEQCKPKIARLRVASRNINETIRKLRGEKVWKKK